jgi:hypothetical protein
MAPRYICQGEYMAGHPGDRGHRGPRAERRADDDERLWRDATHLTLDREPRRLAPNSRPKSPPDRASGTLKGAAVPVDDHFQATFT